MRWVLLAVMVLLAGCRSWDGPAEITLRNGSVITCESGLSFSSFGIKCSDRSRYADPEIPWQLVKGFRAWSS